MLRVGVLGAKGKMGAEVCRAVEGDSDLELVAALDQNDDLAALVDSDAEVVVDFTVIDASRKNLQFLADSGMHAVVGTTGFSADDLAELKAAFLKSNIMIVPNFAIGAVLMMRFAELAAPHFESAEIIELHHDNKIDAPSGTALETAKRMTAASGDWIADPTENEVLAGARGGDHEGVHVHSVRLRGLVAHQEVVLGTQGQTLTIRHDSLDRTSFMPGVLMAIKAVADRPGLTVGLDDLLGI